MEDPNLQQYHHCVAVVILDSVGLCSITSGILLSSCKNKSVLSSSSSKRPQSGSLGNSLASQLLPEEPIKETLVSSEIWESVLQVLEKLE